MKSGGKERDNDIGVLDQLIPLLLLFDVYLYCPGIGGTAQL
jgi:hypothetical protein